MPPTLVLTVDAGGGGKPGHRSLQEAPQVTSTSREPYLHRLQEGNSNPPDDQVFPPLLDQWARRAVQGRSVSPLPLQRHPSCTAMESGEHKLQLGSYREARPLACVGPGSRM